MSRSHFPGPVILVLVLAVLVPRAAVAAETNPPSHQHTPYAELETREIKGLSEVDINELRQGRGWGLALPAELNGVPGPVHLLELRYAIALTPQQVEDVEALYTEMRSEAVTAGERLIEAERALSRAFANGVPQPDELRRLIAEAEAARADLRFVHLSAHLRTPALLTPEQISRYAILRGYRSDPCMHVPDGHDAEMWRKHNGCP